jgi:hypothetical protein
MNVKIIVKLIFLVYDWIYRNIEPPNHIIFGVPHIILFLCEVSQLRTNKDLIFPRVFNHIIVQSLCLFFLVKMDESVFMI